ncbi:hypothetical protein [Bdellovibrio sp. HCB2-146]|uniref:hypothetical protein n=1 Tax=Bdellovibrio sp. HCB2-146 TaxID=3394362 RepID=UPI0039BC3A30
MKTVIALIALMGAFSAHAADRKIGNVIMIERDIENVYDRCVASLNPETKAGEYIFCPIQITKNAGEVLLNKGGGLRYKTPTCSVESDFGNGKMLITYRALSKDATLEDAKRCLQNALKGNEDMIATIQTIE